MAAKDFDRFAKLNVIASVQPYHAIDDGRWAERRIGPERSKTTYAFRSFLDHGVRLALGTDWTVAPLNPMLTLYAAVTRATLDGKHPDGWVPEQKITLAEAIEAYTMGSAYAEFQDNREGLAHARQARRRRHPQRRPVHHEPQKHSRRQGRHHHRRRPRRLEQGISHPCGAADVARAVDVARAPSPATDETPNRQPSTHP